MGMEFLFESYCEICKLNKCLESDSDQPFPSFPFSTLILSPNKKLFLNRNSFSKKNTTLPYTVPSDGNDEDVPIGNIFRMFSL